MMLQELPHRRRSLHSGIASRVCVSILQPIHRSEPFSDWLLCWSRSRVRSSALTRGNRVKSDSLLMTWNRRLCLFLKRPLRLESCHHHTKKYSSQRRKWLTTKGMPSNWSVGCVGIVSQRLARRRFRCRTFSSWLRSRERTCATLWCTPYWTKTELLTFRGLRRSSI